MTRSELIADLRNWATRDDITDAVVNTVLRLAQSAIDRDLRLQDQQKAVQLTVTSIDGAQLPSDFLDVRSVAHVSGVTEPGRFPQETINQFNQRVLLPAPGIASAWAIRADRLLVRPAPDSEESASHVVVNMEYFAQFAPLLEASDTNWLLNHQYDVYFTACMEAVGAYIEDEEMENKWNLKYGVATGKVKAADKRKQIPTTMIHNTNQAAVIGR